MFNLKKMVALESSIEKLFECPSCDFKAIIPAYFETVECNGCRVEFCLSCREREHKGYSCEDFKKWKIENDKGEQALMELLNKGDVKPCPVCGALCHKYAGCNFMTCASPQC